MEPWDTRNEQSISIEFNTSVIIKWDKHPTPRLSPGTKIASTDYPVKTMRLSYVRETPPPDQDLQCEKKVWNHDTQQWVEQINADIGDTVRFNITLTYLGIRNPF